MNVKVKVKVKPTLAVVCLALFAMLAAAQPAAAQQMTDRPRAEIFGGYSHMSHHIGLNGWIVGGDYDPWEHVGFEGEISGHYGSGNILGLISLNNNIYNFNFGPRVFYDTSNDRVSVFGHLLLGASHIGGKTLGINTADTSFSWVLGGGADYSFNPNWAARGQLDYIRTNFFSSGSNDTRFSAGIVYRWAP